MVCRPNKRSTKMRWRTRTRDGSLYAAPPPLHPHFTSTSFVGCLYPKTNNRASFSSTSEARLPDENAFLLVWHEHHSSSLRPNKLLEQNHGAGIGNYLRCICSMLPNISLISTISTSRPSKIWYQGGLKLARCNQICKYCLF